MEKQVTLAAGVSYSGAGLHSGKNVTMTLQPGQPDTGIVFIRTDLPGKPEIHARAELVTSTLKATTLSENGAEVFTVEHLLGALFAMGVDNCRIEMDSPEPPVADGSGLVFAQLVQQAGRTEQEAERKYRVIDRTYSVYDGDKFIMMVPYEGTRVSFTSVNPHPLLGTQYFDISLEDEETFLREIAPARTIGFMREVEQMRKLGLGLGGNLENALVYDDTKCLSVPRFPDELVRHKILDVLGDFSLIGPWKGHIIAVKSGHSYNSQLAKQIVANREDKMAVTLDITEIKKILPHRFPMLLVDRILDLEPMKWAVGVKNITDSELQFLGHFPGEPIMPGVLLIEGMAQVGGVALLYPEENRGKIAVYAKIDKVRFHRKVIPGDQVITRAEVVKIHGNMGVIHCEGKVDGELACECDCFFSLQDKVVR